MEMNSINNGESSLDSRHNQNGNSTPPRRARMSFPSSFFRRPLSTILEYSGFIERNSSSGNESSFSSEIPILRESSEISSSYNGLGRLLRVIGRRNGGAMDGRESREGREGWEGRRRGIRESRGNQVRTRGSSVGETVSERRRFNDDNSATATTNFIENETAEHPSIKQNSNIEAIHETSQQFRSLSRENSSTSFMNTSSPSLSVVSTVGNSTQPVDSESVSININVQEGETVNGNNDELGNESSVLSINTESEERMDGNETVQQNERREETTQRYDLQRAARWFEQGLPFTLLLIIVFIRQHMKGFFVSVWLTLVLIKSNDIIRKQTAFKSDRKISVLFSTIFFLSAHLFYFFSNKGLSSYIRPLYFHTLLASPPFWDAIFIIIMNDSLVRFISMVLKCIILIFFKNTRGRLYRRQGQLLTTIEHFFIFFRAVIPSFVWYKFFLNEKYGNIFSSLIAGFYLTFKVTSTYEKVLGFFTAVKSILRKEVQYGSYSTKEEIESVGEICSICQEKMNAPITLRCRHIFCEDCVSEWFERERTCPLCRAVVKASGLKSYSDGSTTMLLQIF